MAKVTLTASDAIYDLIATLDLPEDPQCQGDVDDCPCVGCRLYDKIVGVLETIDPPTRQKA